MAICKFYQQGRCRYGDDCKFDHVDVGASNRSAPNVNRYAPLQNSDNARGNNGYRGESSSAPAGLPYNLDKAAIITDLTNEKPQWILSAYGPGRQAPAQLFGGLPREQSFEEMRLAHYMAIASGNPPQAVHEADKIYQAAVDQDQFILRDVDAAINFIIQAANEHPNRLDIVRESQAASAGSQLNPFSNQAQSSTPFGAPSQPTSTSTFGTLPQPGAFGQTSGGAFGQPSGLGQNPNPFGAPSQPASTSAFGAPSQPGAFGKPSGGAFGQPSVFGQKSSPFGAPAFGAPSQPGAFGQPSTLGQKPSPFGAPAQTGAFGQPSGGAFGQPSALGQKPNPFAGTSAPVPFGAPSQPAQPNPFGAPSTSNPNPFSSQSTPAQPNPFGGASSTPFGAPSPAPKNPFGAASQAANPSPFGTTPATQPNPFGQSSTAPVASNPFGNPTHQPATDPFGSQQSNTPAAANPFGKRQPNSTAAPSPFGAPSQHVSAPSVRNPPTSTRAPANTNSFSGSDPSLLPKGYTPSGPLGSGQPRVESYITKDAEGRLLSFKGKRVVYKDSVPGTRNGDGSWAKIWFPDGPPEYYATTEAPEEMYTEDIRKMFEKAMSIGGFEGGEIPLVPPKQEWCRWDF